MNDKVVQLDNNPQPEQTAYDTVFSALLNFSTPELKKMFTEVLAHKRQSIKSKLKPGSKIYVVHTEPGENASRGIDLAYRTPGVIERVNIKRCIVKINGRSYDVPMTNIEIADDHEFYPHA